MKKKVLILVALFGLVAFLAQAQLFETHLNLTVYDDAGNPVEGAMVSLYKSVDDYNANKPAIEPLKTNKKGVVKFGPLEPIEYFIFAKKGNMSNDFHGEKVEALTKGKVNKATVIISE